MRGRAIVDLVVSVYRALGEGMALIRHHWRLALVELVPALWLTAIVTTAVHDLRLWESGSWGAPDTVVRVGVTRSDLRTVAGLALTGAAIYSCNAVFAFAALDEEGPSLRRALERGRSRLPRAALMGVVAGLLQIAPRVVPVPPTRTLALAQITGLLTLQLVLFVAVPARLAGVDPRGQPLIQRLLLSGVAVVLSLLAVVPSLVVGRIGTELVASDTWRPLGLLLFAAALVLQVAAMVTVKSVALAAKLLQAPAREPGRESIPI